MVYVIKGAPNRILQTKLHRPRVPADLVCRNRLHAALDGGLDRPLTLISAPAGYGKSLLVSCWVESRGEPCAWLSLDESDRDVSEFLESLLAALATSSNARFPSTLTLVRSATPVPTSVLAKSLLNELHAADRHFLLVLDDYHSIGSRTEVHALMRALLEQPTSNLSMLLLTRRDPPLQLPRLRALGQLAEVRLAQLRFSDAECRTLLQGSIGLDASHAAIANLQREMEGWAAGLRLVMLALQGNDAPDHALQHLAGGVQTAREYLLAEVLDGLPPGMRDALLVTSIVERFCADLTETLLGELGASEGARIQGAHLLRDLQQWNLFTIELDSQGEWFRFHHLFRELLQAQMMRRIDAATLRAIHLRASAWFEAQGLIDEAIRHALDADDGDRAASILERHRRAEQDRGPWWNIERWLSLLPQALLEQRPSLLLARAWIWHYRHRQAQVRQVMDQLHQIASLDELEPVSRGEAKLFEGSTAFWSGRLTDARRLLQEAQALSSPHFGAHAGLTEIYLAVTEQMLGLAEPCLQRLAQRISDGSQYSVKYQVNLATARGLAQTLRGGLHHAVDEGHRLLDLSKSQHIAYNEAWGDYLAGSNLLRLGEPERAIAHLRLVVERRFVVHTRAAIDGMAGLALALQRSNQAADAEEAEQAMSDFARESADPDVQVVAASAGARLALLRAESEAARRWLQGATDGLIAAPLFIWIESPVLTLTRVWIATGPSSEIALALQRLSQLADAARAVHNRCQLTEVQVLQAIALHKLGRCDEALDGLGSALDAASASGHRLPFVEPGPLVAELLHLFIKQRDHSGFAQQLLAAFDETNEHAASKDPARSRLDHNPDQALARSLTPREVDMLACLMQRLSNKGIARQLVLSDETVKFHLHNLYGKLGVGRRQEAAVLAERLRPYLQL